MRCPSSVPPTGPLVANPGCYATAALLALAPLADAIDPGRRRRRRASPASRAPAATLKPSSHAGSVLENVSPYAVGTHQHAPEIEQVLGFPVCFVPHLLPVRRGLIATCYVRRRRATCARCSRPPTPARTSCACCRRASRPTSPACRAPTPPRSASSRTGRPGRRSSICALDNLGKGAAGQAVQNANLALGPRRDGRPAALRGARLMALPRRTARRRWERSPPRRASSPRPSTPGSAGASLDLALVRSLVPAVGAAMFTANRVQAAPVHRLAGAPRSWPSRRRSSINSGVANAATGEQGELDALRDRGRGGALLGLDAEQVLVLSTGVIGAPLPIDQRARRARRGGPARSRADGGAAAAEAILTTDTAPKEAVGLARTASPSAAWRRARG